MGKQNDKQCKIQNSACRPTASYADVYHQLAFILYVYKNTWIGDLGASCHIINDDMGLYNVINIVKAGVSLFLLTCKLLQRGKICSDEKNIIVLKTANGTVILDCQINTQD